MSVQTLNVDEYAQSSNWVEIINFSKLMLLWLMFIFGAVCRLLRGRSFGSEYPY